MINPEDLVKMTPEQVKACDPLEVLTSSLVMLAGAVDNARAGKDAMGLLNAIGRVLQICDALEVIGMKMAAKVVAHSLKAAAAAGDPKAQAVLDEAKAKGINIDNAKVEIEKVEEKKQKEAAADFGFSLGMPMKPGQA